MRTIPETQDGLLEFCGVHAPVWEARAEELGLLASDVTQLVSLLNDAETASREAARAREAAKAATVASTQQLALLRDRAAALVRVIKAHAENRANPADVYAAAQLPVPMRGGAPQAPAPADDVRLALTPTGAIEVSWTAKDAAASAGTFYTVLRKLSSDATWTVVGASPGATSTRRRMTFVDPSVPASAAADGAMYVVQGRRGALASRMSTAVVARFGRSENIRTTKALHAMPMTSAA